MYMLYSFKNEFILKRQWTSIAKGISVKKVSQFFMLNASNLWCISHQSQADWASLSIKKNFIAPLSCDCMWSWIYSLAAVKRIWLALLSHALNYAPDDPNWEEM